MDVEANFNLSAATALQLAGSETSFRSRPTPSREPRDPPPTLTLHRRALAPTATVVGTEDALHVVQIPCIAWSCMLCTSETRRSISCFKLEPHRQAETDTRMVQRVLEKLVSTSFNRFGHTQTVQGSIRLSRLGDPALF